MGAALEEAVIERCHQRVLLGALDAAEPVGSIEPCAALFLIRVRSKRLAAAVDAAAGACHHFHKVEVLAVLDALDQVGSIPEAAHNADAHFLFAHHHMRFLHAFHAAHAGESDRAQRRAALVRSKAAKHSFRHAAGHAEDHARAGHRAKGHVGRFGLDVAEQDARFLDHAHELLCGEHIVHVRLAIHLELIAHRLEFLRGAGHHGYMHALALRIAVLLADNRREHLHRGLAGGNMLHQFGVAVLAVAHPCRAAGGEHRHLRLALREALCQLLGFLDDGHVRARRSVVYLVKAHPVERSHDLAHGVLARGRAKFLAKRHAHCRRDLHGHFDRGIIEDLPDIRNVVLHNDRARRAGLRALAAANAGGLCKRHVERGADGHPGTAVRKVDRTHVLHFAAHTHAVAAEDALVLVAHDAHRGILDLRLFRGVREAHIVDVKALCKVLQLAAAVVVASGAVAAVVRKQQLKDHLAVFAQALRVGADLHPSLRGRGACSFKAAPLVFHHAHAACAIDRKLGMIAEGGHLHADLADQLQQVLFPVDLNRDTVYRHEFFFLDGHVSPP